MKIVRKLILCILFFLPLAASAASDVPTLSGVIVNIPDFSIQGFTYLPDGRAAISGIDWTSSFLGMIFESSFPRRARTRIYTPEQIEDLKKGLPVTPQVETKAGAGTVYAVPGRILVRNVFYPFGVVLVLDDRTLETIQRIEFSTDPRKHIALGDGKAYPGYMSVSRDGSTIAVPYADNYVKVMRWDGSKYSGVIELKSAKGTFWSDAIPNVSISAEGRYLVVDPSDWARKIVVFDLQASDPQASKTTQWINGYFKSVPLNIPHTDQFLFNTNDGLVGTFDAPSTSLPMPPVPFIDPASKGRYGLVAFESASADGSRILSYESDYYHGTFSVLSRELNPLAELKAVGRYLYGTISPDGKTVVYRNGCKNLEIFDLSSLK